MSSSPVPVEPKKSVRLAQKRKLREEAGPQGTTEDDNYYFTPYQFSKSGSPVRAKSSPSGGNSPNPTTASPAKKIKGKPDVSDSPLVSTNVSNTTRAHAPSPKLAKLLSNTVRAGSSKVASSEDSSPGTSTAGQQSPVKKKLSKPGTSTAVVTEEEALEEEKWLNALEAGNLEELDEELRQMKNPKLMTARQRAMMEKKDRDAFGFTVDDDSNSGLFRKDKEKLVITQEMMRMKAEKMEKRRQLAQEKKEIDRKRTMDRLLKKQHSKAIKVSNKPKAISKKLTATDLKVTLISRSNETIIAFPMGFPSPFEASNPPRLISPKICQADGCSKPKKYSCSKTGVPLCSLHCYKKNLSSYQNIN